MKKQKILYLFGILLLVSVGILLYGLLFPSIPPGMQKNEVLTLGTVVKIKQGLEAYHKEYHKFPTGNVSTVQKVLSGTNIDGQNPKQSVLLRIKEHKYYNASGEIIDAWKQPIKLELMTNGEIQIYSFGPNKQDNHANGDDIVVTTDCK